MLSADQIDHIRRFLQTVNSLYQEIPWKAEILKAEKKRRPVKGPWIVEAPYYLVFYSEPRDGYLENAGFILEQVVLYMTLKGIGSCYQGMAKAVPNPEWTAAGMAPVMTVAFGLPEDTCIRKPELAKRHSLSELVLCKEEVGDEMRCIMQAARLAPSAMNRQPWKLVVYHNRIHLFRKNPRLPFWQLQRLDMGIVLCHVVAAAEEQWMNPAVCRLDSIESLNLRDYEYTATVRLSWRQDEDVWEKID